MMLHGLVEGLHTAASVIATASIVANFLPPSTTYDAYPGFKRFYETFIVRTVAAVSVSVRAQYPSLAVPMFGLTQPQLPAPAPKVE